MFGIGMPELIIILAVALIVIGPKKLPDLAKSLGRAFNEFRKATQELKASIDLDDGLKDVKKSFDDLHSDLRQGVSERKPDDAASSGGGASPESGPPPSATAPPETAAPRSGEKTREGNPPHDP